jgi:hypothetical protein
MKGGGEGGGDRRRGGDIGRKRGGEERRSEGLGADGTERRGGFVNISTALTIQSPTS